MGKKLRKSIRKAKKMTDKPIPGGYVTFQLLDEIAMANANMKKDIEAVTRVSVDQVEIYRILAKFSLQMQEIDKSVNGLNEIFRRNK